MTQDDKKRAVARAAIDYVPSGEIIGVGTGSTVNFFIDCLKEIKGRVAGAVATSRETAKRLKDAGIEVASLNDCDRLAIYFDGADQISAGLQMIKGGGGALLREKIVASLSDSFMCMVDDSKVVRALDAGKFPVAVEVIPEARAKVAREIVALGGSPVLRLGFKTESGNEILDVSNLDLSRPIAMEDALNRLVGVVENGVFGRFGAPSALIGTEDGVRRRDVGDR